MRRKLVNKKVRKLYRHSGSYSVTLPIEIIRQLKWQKKQKVVAVKKGKGILITDWE